MTHKVRDVILLMHSSEHGGIDWCEWYGSIFRTIKEDVVDQAMSS
jgi:hypothetical protein